MSGSADAGAFVDGFEVPAGMRAIVRCITYADASPGGTGAVGALVVPGGVFCCVASVLGAQSVELEELHIVAYAGEELQVFRGSGALFWTVSGYLLTD